MAEHSRASTRTGPFIRGCWRGRQRQRRRIVSLGDSVLLDKPEHTLLSQVQGLIMAIKDPLVSLFAIMSTSQLLGLSFVQYFPTLVDSHPSIVKYNDLIRGLGLLKHLDLILPTLNFWLRRLTIFFYTLILF